MRSRSIVPSLAVLTLVSLVSAGEAPLGRFAESASRFAEQVSAQVLPYWYDHTVDWKRGGFVLAADARQAAAPATEKQIVTQARMVWGFSHAVLEGCRDPQRDYLKAARQGYEFITRHFLDPENGGYFWKTDLEGTPVVDRKYLYGEAFVIYAFVEYYRASLDRSALERALDLYRTIQKHCHDRTFLGWGEHYTRDWRWITEQDAQIEVERAGLKSANAHLHWMEALSELSDATHDASVKASLSEALAINATYFYPRDPAQACFHRRPNWGAVTDPRSAGLSYGHNVEFAWLMIRAEEVLGRRPSWNHFNAILAHALRVGYDFEHGGLYHRGVGEEAPTDTDKVWWVQAEMLAALTDSLKHERTARAEEALEKLIGFLNAHQIDPGTGVWYETVTADGRPKSTALAHNWKGNYHDLRALWKFIDAVRGDR